MNSTLVYTQLIDFEEAEELAEADFDYVTEIEEVKLLRKRKRGQKYI